MTMILSFDWSRGITGLEYCVLIGPNVQVRDGDTGIPRPVEVNIEGDRLGYFTLVTR